MNARMLLGFVLVGILIIACSPRHYIYDEVFYHRYPLDLVEKGFSADFLRGLIAPPGPLHAFVHAAFYPLWGLDAVGMRFVTFGLYIATGFMVSAIVRRTQSAEIGQLVPLHLALPFGGPCAFLALTESPAMCAVSLGLLLVVAAVELDGPAGAGGTRRISLAVGGGLLVGAAVWGRQNYLIVAAALPLLLLFPQGRLRPAMVAVPVAIVVVMTAGLFLTWGGLVPSAVSFVAVPQIVSPGFQNIFGLNASFVFYSFAYAAIPVALLMPGYLYWTRRNVVASIALAVFMVAIVPELRMLPSKFVLERILGRRVDLAAFAFGSSFLSLAWLLILSTLQHLNEKRHDAWFWCFTIAWMGILVSNGKIGHQFSSRYVVVAYPLLLAAGASTLVRGRWMWARVLAGMGAALLQALNYMAS